MDPQYSIVLIIGTPIEVPLILGNPNIAPQARGPTSIPHFERGAPCSCETGLHVRA